MSGSIIPQAQQNPLVEKGGKVSLPWLLFFNALPQLVFPAPAHTNSPGSPNQLSYDQSYLYICTAKNTWGRILLDHAF